MAARPNAKFRSPRCDMSAKISIKCQLKSIFCKIFQKFALNVSILTSNWPWSCWQRFKHYQSICFKINWNIFHRLVFLGWNVERIMPHLSRFAVTIKILDPCWSFSSFKFPSNMNSMTNFCLSWFFDAKNASKISLNCQNVFGCNMYYSKLYCIALINSLQSKYSHTWYFVLQFTW